MRSDTDARGRVVFPAIREEEQHEQGSSSGAEIHAPFEIILGGGEVFWREACVDVPTSISGVFGVRKADRKAAETFARNPAAPSGKLVERGVQQGRVDRLAK